MTEWTIWGSGGGNNNADNASAVSVGTKKRTSATVPLWGLGLRYFRGTLSAGTKTGRIFRTGDQAVISEVVTFTDSGTGWQEKRFVTPVALALDTLYTSGVLFPSGGLSFTPNYFAPGNPGASGVTNGPITAPSNADAPGQGVFTGGGTLVCPTSSFNSTCYWVDWIVTDANPFTIALNGVPSAAAVGQPTITPGPATIALNGIAGAAAVGTPTLAPGPAGISLDGIAPTSAAGQPTLTPGPANVALSGVPSAAQVGQPTLTPGPATISLSGIPGASAVGQPRLVEPGAIEPDWDFRFGPPYTDSFRFGPPHL